MWAAQPINTVFKERHEEETRSVPPSVVLRWRKERGHCGSSSIGRPQQWTRHRRAARSDGSSETQLGLISMWSAALNNMSWSVCCSESTYSAIGEEGVTLLHQDSLDHGRVGHTQDGLAAIKNATSENKRKEYAENKFFVESHTQTSSIHKDSPPYFPVFLEALRVKVVESLRVNRNISS